MRRNECIRSFWFSHKWSRHCASWQIVFNRFTRIELPRSRGLHWRTYDVRVKGQRQPPHHPNLTNRIDSSPCPLLDRGGEGEPFRPLSRTSGSAKYERALCVVPPADSALFV